MRKGACALVLVLGAAAADETAARLRAAVDACQGAVHTLKCVVEISFRGQTQELKPEVPVLVLDATGLAVSPDPAKMIRFSGAGQGAMQGISVDTKQLLLVHADGKEQEAKSVGRDADFGLLFLRTQDGKPLGCLPAVRGKPLEIGDEVFLVRRLSSAHPEPFCKAARIVTVMQKPRLMYLLSEEGAGCVAMSSEGEVVGVSVVVKETDADSGRESSMNVVLPMAQILEAARGIHEDGDGDKAAPPSEEKAPDDGK